MSWDERFALTWTRRSTTTMSAFPGDSCNVDECLSTRSLWVGCNSELQAPRRFSDEAGTRAAAPFPAPLSPLAALCLCCARDRVHEAEHVQPRRQCGAN